MILSNNATKALSSDIGRRYLFKNAYQVSGNGSYTYSGTKYLNEIVDRCQDLAKDIFNVEYVSIYPVSGHQANMGVLFAFTKPNDLIICHSPESGGYPGLDKNRLPKFLGLDVAYFPMREDIKISIDIEKTKEMIFAKKPKLIIFSSAHTLLQPKLKEFVDVCKAVDCKIVYDGSHPLGLIAGKHFYDPLNQGVDIFIGGTQKSFWGPQGAIIATNKYIDEIQNVEQFVMVDNPHFNRIDALTVALEEMKEFGYNYADQIIKNSKTLARCLFEYGLPVQYENMGFTESHMFKFQVFDGYLDLVNNLKKANIMIDSAGRIGTNEMTRMGIQESEMNEIAKFINIIYRDGFSEKIKQSVLSFRSLFNDIQFC